MTVFTLPDPDAVQFATPQAWHQRVAGLVAVISGARWWIGDALAAAPSEEARSELIMNTDPRLDPGECGTYQAVAERFPPDARHPVPWSFHHMCVNLPADVAHQLLSNAAIERWRVRHMQRAVNEFRLSAAEAV